ncbi:hypothetical protein PSTT_05514 [Puccinia striiformis]|uniref:Metallo-beta-lactamase domain-containing protein n=1 Tax=Puccinia striiformis TaxID=27350 RepID=A0A2S4VNF4_9BASI|nr:hypothetical protein PSTT_05514 [Puccinia striiformis]
MGDERRANSQMAGQEGLVATLFDPTVHSYSSCPSKPTSLFVVLPVYQPLIIERCNFYHRHQNPDHPSSHRSTWHRPSSTFSSSAVPSTSDQLLGGQASQEGCGCCLSTLAADGSGRKNARRNTSAIVQFQTDHALQEPPKRPATILIDVGKSFCEAAREHFPKNDLDRIDAVLLTHHPQMVWTTFEVPLSKPQYQSIVVAKIFPYMVNPGGGTGGGDVPAFQWNIIESDVPFELLGVQVSPLKVYHGCYFNAAGQPECPYECLAFLFDQTFCYMSDVSSIPDPTWTALGCPPSIPLKRSMSHCTEKSSSDSDHPSIFTTSSRLDSTASSASSVSDSEGPPAGLPLLIVDTMRLEPHISHFGIAEAVETAVKLRAHRTYILGFTHVWEAACELISENSNTLSRTTVDSSSDAEETTELGDDPPRFARQALALCEDYIKDTPLWIRPAFDGPCHHY